MPLPGNLSLAEVHMTPLSNQQFTAYVGIDWADTKHDICLQAAGDIRREFDCIPHQVARIDDWAKSLQQGVGGAVAAALELARGPIVAALRRSDCLRLSPFTPSTLARSRNAVQPSR